MQRPSGRFASIWLGRRMAPRNLVTEKGYDSASWSERPCCHSCSTTFRQFSDKASRVESISANGISKSFSLRLLVDFQRPAASFRFPASHQFTYDIASVMIGELGIRKANTCVVSEHVLVRPQFEAIDRHFSPHTLTKLIRVRPMKLPMGSALD